MTAEGHDFSRAQECVRFGVRAKYQLTAALARLRERGDPPRRVGEGLADLHEEKQPLTPGFAVPSRLGEGRYQLWPRCESKCRNSRARLVVQARINPCPFPGLSSVRE
jgi:hypothetical protein